MTSTKVIYDQKCRIAMIVMVAAILFSIPLGFRRTMNGFYMELQNEFQNGEFNDGLSIQNDLNERIDLAYNFATVAKRYLDADDPAVTAILAARLALSEAVTPGEMYDANLALTAASSDLYEALEGIELSEKDDAYRRSIYNDMASRNDTISHDPYNRLAYEYNQKLNDFPADLLSDLIGISQAELFQ